MMDSVANSGQWVLVGNIIADNNDDWQTKYGLGMDCPSDNWPQSTTTLHFYLNIYLIRYHQQRYPGQCNVLRVEKCNVFKQTKDKNSAFQSISEYLLAKYAAESVLVVISNPMLLLL